MVPLRAGSREQHGLLHGVGRAGPHKPDPAPQPQVRASGISVGLGMEMGTAMDKARPGQASACGSGTEPVSAAATAKQCRAAIQHSHSWGRDWGPELWGTATPLGQKSALDKVCPWCSQQVLPTATQGTGLKRKSPSWLHWCWTGPQSWHSDPSAV